MSADLSLTASVERAVASAEWLTPADAAAVYWLRHLAAIIDNDPEQIPKVGKLFESAMSVLGLTIAGRSVKPENPKKDVNRLDEIKKQSIDRLRDAANHVAETQPAESRRGHSGDGRPGGNSADAVAGKRGARNRKDSS